MKRRGLKWTAAGIVGLALIVLGAHLAWEHHRYRLETPKGIIRIGMTQDKVRAALGTERGTRAEGQHEWSWWGDSRDTSVAVFYDPEGRVTGASSRRTGRAEASIPRPSLIEHVRSWFTGKGEE